MSIGSDAQKLVYFFAEKDGISIVSFVGPFCQNMTSVLDDCLKEICGKNSAYILLGFRDVPYLDPAMLDPFVQFQEAIRANGAKLLVCSLHPDIRKLMQEQNVFNSEEVRNNLAEALHTLVIPIAA
jgi:anti-anti-sigma regulatory factor